MFQLTQKTLFSNAFPFTACPEEVPVMFVIKMTISVLLLVTNGAGRFINILSLTPDCSGIVIRGGEAVVRVFSF